MSKYIYPALFEKDENNAICVSFPDIPGCFTSGADLQEAYDNAEDALCLMLYDMEECGKKIPAGLASYGYRNDWRRVCIDRPLRYHGLPPAV